MSLKTFAENAVNALISGASMAVGLFHGLGVVVGCLSLFYSLTCPSCDVVMVLVSFLLLAYCGKEFVEFMKEEYGDTLREQVLSELKSES